MKGFIFKKLRNFDSNAVGIAAGGRLTPEKNSLLKANCNNSSYQ